MTDDSPSAALLRRVADAIPAPVGPDCVRVGIDGPDGAGKTVFADRLATVVRDQGRPLVRVSADDFLNVRAIRHRRGRTSPEGFWLDSYDDERLLAAVLGPLGPGGSRRYRSRCYDPTTDAAIDDPEAVAPPGAVLVLDGLFLHRTALAGCWELSVFLDVPFAVTARRMATRDGSPPDPTHPSLHRYVAGQRIYYRERDPRRRASLVVDNADLDHPRLIRVCDSP